MAILNLDHVNIRTPRVAETVIFYVDLLGMTATVPPGVEDMSRAAWLCDEAGAPAIHVGSTEQEYPGGRSGEPINEGSGRVHHVAFECSNYSEMLDQLRRQNQPVELNDVPQIALRQIFVRDPNDILVELNFR